MTEEYISDNTDMCYETGFNEENCVNINEAADDNSSLESSNIEESINTNIGIEENRCNIIQEPGTLSTFMGESLYGDFQNPNELGSPVKTHQGIEEISNSPNSEEILQDFELGGTIVPSLHTHTSPINESETASSTTLDIDNFVNTPSNETLDVHEDDIARLKERVQGMERSEHKGEISFGKKMCPTRHGCQGATDCDYCGGDYPD